MVEMGTLCPTCQKHRAYKSVQTADGLPPKSPNDILFYKLECDHVWGAGNVKEYMKSVVDIRKSMAEKIQQIHEDGRMAMIKSYKALESTKQGGRN